jgi:hypothetical protein
VNRPYPLTAPCGRPAPEDVDAAGEPFSCPAEIVVHGNALWVGIIDDGTVIPGRPR